MKISAIKTGKQLFDEFLTVIKPTVREQTFLLYERTAKNYIRPKFDDMALLDISALDIEKLYAELLGRLSPVTVSKVHTLLKKALNKARLWKWIELNPALDVKPPKITKKSRVVLTGDEINRFLQSCADSRQRAMFAFFAHTGARPSEVLGAKWCDINNGVWQVTQSLVQSRHRKFKLDGLKTASSKREIPLSNDLQEILERHRIEQLKFRLQSRYWHDHDLIFPTDTGKPQRLSNLGEKINKIRIKAGIEKRVTPHLFRHSFISLMINGGKNIKAVSQIAGHSEVKTTLAVYTHTTFEDKQKIIDDLGQIIKIA